MIRVTYLVYGKEGHTQRESYSKSWCFSTIKGGEECSVCVLNSDKTDTHAYTKVSIYCESLSVADSLIRSQVDDGIFENSYVSKVERHSLTTLNSHTVFHDFRVL